MSYSVTELNTLIKNIITDLFKNPISIQGEISNIKLANDNLFLTLKDSTSSINIIQWKYGKKVNLKNGDMVNIDGRLTCYSKNGTYNITASNIEKQGVGDIHLEYEKLRLKYNKLGYFDTNKKKKISQKITKIGILTAPEGAALQDVLYVLMKNKFMGKIIIKRCIVQGISCPSSVVEGISYLNQWKDSTDGANLDIILITRGGGSFEDLMGYSDKLVIEAIYKSKIYTISAIGHEIDFMLSDFVADYRAPTPSVAGEIISEYQMKRIDNYNSAKTYFDEYLILQINQTINYLNLKLHNIKNTCPDISTKINNQIENNNKIKNDMFQILNNKITQHNDKLKVLNNDISKYDIDNMLSNGYVVLTRNNSIIDSIKTIKAGQKLKLRLRDGQANIIIESIQHGI